MIRPSMYALILLFVFTPGCDRKPVKGEAPPPVEEARVEPCKAVPNGQVDGLPQRPDGLCLDPRFDVRRYGTGAPAALDDVCVEQFNGECELYKSFGLEGVKILRYVQSDGQPGTVNVVVSSFRRSEGAYGFFTRRILGSGVPSQATVAPFKVEGRGVLGIGMAVLWRGKNVLEFTYVSEDETPSELERSGKKLLPKLVETVARSQVGQTEPPFGVQVLEQLGVGELGASQVSDGLLGITGSGPGNVGYFEKEPLPHRVILAERADEEGSRDLARLLLRSGPNQKLKTRNVTRLRRVEEGATPETWYFRREDETVCLVGPLDLNADPSLSTPDARKKHEQEWEAFALDRLDQVSKALRVAGENAAKEKATLTHLSQ